MMSAFLGLSVGARCWGDRMAHLRKGRRELLQTLRQPQQRSDRAGQRRGLYDALQIFKQRCVALDKLPGATVLPPDLTWRQRRGIEVLQSRKVKGEAVLLAGLITVPWLELCLEDTATNSGSRSSVLQLI